ncbi:MAG: hypothetical protein ACR2FO_02145 [Actinomycetota bacterium]
MFGPEIGRAARLKVASSETLFRRVARLSPVVPLLLTAVYLLVLPFNLQRLLRIVFLNSDVASIPVLSEQIASGEGTAWISIVTYYSTFLFNLATRWLPFHRGLWEGSSIVLALAGVVLMSWSARQAAGRGAGVLMFVLGAAASPLLLMNTLGLRGPTWFTVGLLSALLVLMVRVVESGTSRRLLVAAVVVTGAVTGVNLASDPLLLASAIGPFLVAAVLAVLIVPTRKGHIAGASAGLCFLIAASAAITRLGMTHLGFSVGHQGAIDPAEVTFASGSIIGRNLGLFLTDMLTFTNGDFLGRPLSLASVARLAIGIACLMSLCLPLVVLRRRLMLRSLSPADGSAAPVLIAFWASSAALVAAGFVFSNIAFDGLASARYLVPVYYACAGCTAIWAANSSRQRLAVALIATLICLFSIKGQFSLVGTGEAERLSVDGPRVISLLRDEGLSRGYSTYWDSLSLTWLSDMRVTIAPVVDCLIPDRGLCAFPVNSFERWYQPGAASRTFLLVGPERPWGLRSPPPPLLGTATEVHKVGEFSVYVYSYDLALRIKPSKQ